MEIFLFKGNICIFFLSIHQSKDINFLQVDAWIDLISTYKLSKGLNRHRQDYFKLNIERQMT